MALMEPMLGVARTAWKFVLPVAVAVIVAAVVGWYVVAAVLVLLVGYLIYFFRDPERRTPRIPNSFCSPADGKVVSVIEVPCEHMPEGRAKRVAIFLNVFNVHVQRSPYAGQVYRVDRREGRCMNAMNEKCSEENEAVTVWMKTDFGPLGVRQISGAIARRIICMAKVDDHLERGERYGIIQFGSRVELFLPLSATVKVQPGQKVKGGETCLAVLYEEEVRKGIVRESCTEVPLTAQAG